MARLLIALKPGEDVVAATLKAWSATPFVWGESDCALSVLAYLEAATGTYIPEIAVPSYWGKVGAKLLLRGVGGFTSIAGDLVELVGCERTADPVRGDVGLVDLPGIGLTACLCLGDGVWAGRGDEEVFTARMTPTVAWSVPCRS